MLHKNMLVAWESFPPQLTIQLAGHIGEDEYMAFGVSGEQGKSSMKGGDVAVAYMDEYLGHVEDYNLTARLFGKSTWRPSPNLFYFPGRSVTWCKGNKEEPAVISC